MKRRVDFILLLLVAGAIVNVAVAWGCVAKGALEFGLLRGNCSYTENPEYAGLTITFTSNRNWQARRQMSHYYMIGIVRATGVTYDEFKMSVPGWSMFARGEPLLILASEYDSQNLSATFDEHACGWPLMAVRGYRLATQQTSVPIGQALPPARDVLKYGLLEVNRDNLPFFPIWPGFAINTVFYAAVVWMLCAVPFGLRRRRRIKRGLCPKCAYPRGAGTNDVCTECGAAVRSIAE